MKKFLVVAPVLMAIAILGGWIGFAIAVELYKPDEERLKQIVSAEYLGEWSSYTNLPTIKPDDCAVMKAGSNERDTNVYFVGVCQSNVDGELVTFEVRLNEVGRVERFDTQP